jgi:hypothetical protein
MVRATPHGKSPKRPRRVCPVCQRPVSVDRLFRYVGTRVTLSVCMARACTRPAPFAHCAVGPRRCGAHKKW